MTTSMRGFALRAVLRPWVAQVVASIHPFTEVRISIPAQAPTATPTATPRASISSLCSLTQSIPPWILSDSHPMVSVIVGLSHEIRSLTPPMMVAWRLPAAPSMVLVDRAAACAVSSEPSSSTAALNS